MKTKTFLASTAVALFVSLSLAQAADNVQIIDDVAVPAEQSLWYVSLFGGVSFPQDVKADFSDSSADQTLTVHFNTGYIVGGVVGRQFTDKIRGELEVSYAWYNADSFNTVQTDKPAGTTNAFSGPVHAALRTTYLLGNVWVDVAQFGGAKLYVGGGLGAAHTDIRDRSGGGIDDWSFAAQVGAGVTYALTSNLDLDLGYRFKGAFDIDVKAGGGNTQIYKGGNLLTHNVQIGLRMKF